MLMVTSAGPHLEDCKGTFFFFALDPLGPHTDCRGMITGRLLVMLRIGITLSSGSGASWPADDYINTVQCSAVQCSD
jgi:hypothetical protein